MLCTFRNITLAKVEKLSLRGNQIKLIEDGFFLPFPNVQIIHMGDNKLQSLCMSNITLDKVEKLLLGGNQINQIEDVSLLSFPNVRIIDLTDNNLHSLYVSNITLEKVETLWLSRNQIYNIHDSFLQSFPNVTNIHLAWNFLSVLHIISTSLDMLMTLDLSRNRITYIEDFFFQSFPNVRNITLNYNSLMSLPQCNESLDKVQAIFLSHNKIKHLEESFFLSLPNVRTIQLSHNKLHAVHSHMFMLAIQRGFVGINLDHNEILLGIPTHTQSRQECDETSTLGNSVMDLSGNNIHHIHDLFHGWVYNDSQIKCWIQAGIFHIMNIRDNPLTLDCEDCSIYSEALHAGKLPLFKEAQATWPHTGKKIAIRNITQSDIDNMYCESDPRLCPDKCIFMCISTRLQM